jgi:hypothetical protein
MSNLRPGDINADEIQRILWGVLVVMIKDYLAGSDYQKKQARRWLFDDDPPGLEGVSAKIACDILGLDLKRLRQLISTRADVTLPKDVIHRPYKRTKAERDKYRSRYKKRGHRQTRYHQNIIRPELRSDLSHHQSPADGIPSG